MLGREDQQIPRLESCDMSEAQKADPITNIHGLMIVTLEQLGGESRHVGIDKKSHRSSQPGNG